MSVLLTGGAGYIGSHTAVVLLEQGYDVLVVDNFSNSKPDVIQRIEKITGRKCPCINADLLDEQTVSYIFGQHDINSVIHFAGYKAVGESVAKPADYYHNNLGGAINLIQAMQKAGVNQFIFSSSATVYRADNPVPYVEDQPLGAINPYGWTKIFIEQMLRDVCVSNPEWSVSLLRYFNPIGAHKSGLIGEDPKGIPNNLLPYVAKVASGELPEIRIFGDDYDTPDGTGIRDYIHVMDLARGHLLAMNHIKGRFGSCVYNLGTGKGHSVIEVIKAFEKACGTELPKIIEPRRAGDLGAVYANVDLAGSELGFKTEYDLDDMCTDAWSWQSNNRGMI